MVFRDESVVSYWSESCWNEPWQTVTARLGGGGKGMER